MEAINRCPACSGIPFACSVEELKGLLCQEHFDDETRLQAEILREQLDAISDR